MIGQRLNVSRFGDSHPPPQCLKCPNGRGLWQNRGRENCIAGLGGNKSN